MYRTLALAALAFAATQADAGTLAHYRAKCKMALEHRFKFEGICSVSVGPDQGAMLYRITPPEGGNDIEVRHFPKRTGTVNGVPAKEVAVVRGWLHFEASDGTDLRFTMPPKDLEF